jgi:hypothetical protein
MMRVPEKKETEPRRGDEKKVNRTMPVMSDRLAV